MNAGEDFVKVQNVFFVSHNEGPFNQFDFTVKRGEIHAILGEHGCGKSILCKLIGGAVRPDNGLIEIKGKAYSGLTTSLAHRAGIRLITQENPMFENMSVAANLFLNNRNVFKIPFRSHKRLCKNAVNYLQEWGIEIDPEIDLSRLNTGDRLLVHVLKDLHFNPQLLILDECFEKLTESYRDKLKEILLAMNRRGMAVLYVTHKIDEIYEFAHRVTIIRGGKVMFTDSVDKTDKINLIRLAYTQLPVETEAENITQEFYTLLKYNQAILERLPVNLLVVDSKMKIKIINEAAKAFFRLPDTYLYNSDITQLLRDTTGEVIPNISQAIDAKKSGRFFDQKVSIDGDFRRTNITVFPIYDGNYFIGSIIIFNDITEQESLREKVVLSEKLSSLGLLAAGVAHEINNPLEIIYHFIDHIRSAKSEVEINTALENIESEVEAISEIVKNLIHLGGNNVERFEQIEIGELINGITRLIKHNASQRNIALSVKQPVQEIYITANAIEIKQVFLNIIKNSFEAMEKGGTLDIEVAATRSESGENVHISFIDSGKGIEVSVVDDLFLPFYSTKGSHPENLGLGLSISYSIIQKYGGTINFKKRETEGSIFTVILPSVEID
jgi:signal transduction histidine kinase/ABC-type branched-subunit amino acid transport system ATPase component